MFAFRAVPGTGGAVGFAAAPECSEVVRWSGLPRDVYCPEISTKSALVPRFGHREIGAITASLLSSDLGMVG